MKGYKPKQANVVKLKKYLIKETNNGKTKISINTSNARK